LRAHVAEFLGTFVLVFAGCGAIAVASRYSGINHIGVALAFGLAVAVMIYALGHISGAHLNPAVSVGFALGRHFPWRLVASYSTAQILGPDADLGVTTPSGTDFQSVAWEAVLTFVLMLVVTAVATDTRAVGEAAALAIGGAVCLGALVGGPVSGASMNPARSIGPALVSGDLTSLWVYIVGPIAGAAAAAAVYRYLRGAQPEQVSS